MTPALQDLVEFKVSLCEQVVQPPGRSTAPCMVP